MQISQDTATAAGASDPNARMMRGATLAYVLALTFIAGLSITVHVLLDNVIAQQRDSATVINVAGRQRMLSQRIALLASDLRAGDAEARPALLEAADLMERSQWAVVHGGDLGIQKARPAPKEQEANTDEVDRLVHDYVLSARSLAQTPSGPAADQTYEGLHHAARHSLLPVLNEVVTRFETEANGRIEWLRSIQKIVLVILLVTLAAEGLFIFKPLIDRLRRHAVKLADLASRDYLTGLWNRRAFFEAAERELGLANRSLKPLSIVVLDLDRFKAVNDTYGHGTGDAVLKRFSDVARQTLRRTDILGRIGGEEFAVLVPEANAQAAAVVAEKLRAAIADDQPGETPAVTVSIGVAEVSMQKGGIAAAIERADQALYEAKRSGRNRVVVA